MHAQAAVEQRVSAAQGAATEQRHGARGRVQDAAEGIAGQEALEQAAARCRGLARAVQRARLHADLLRVAGRAAAALGVRTQRGTSGRPKKTGAPESLGLPGMTSRQLAKK